MAAKVPLPPPAMRQQMQQMMGGGTPPPSHVPPHLHEMTKHDARLVNLDTGMHVDSKGVEHKTHPGNPAKVGPLTVIFAHNMGHPPMRFGDHAKQNTAVHKQMRGKARPHPNALAIQIAGRMKLPRKPPKAATPPEGPLAQATALVPPSQLPITPLPSRGRPPLPPRKTG